jgi:hypothetical protein
MSKRNQTDEARAKSRESAAEVNKRYAEDPEFRDSVDRSKRDGWTPEARSAYGRVSSACRREEWKDEARHALGVAATSAMMVREWALYRDKWMKRSAIGLLAASTPEAQAKLNATKSTTMKKRWAEDDGTMLKAIMGNYRTHHKVPYKDHLMRSKWEVAWAELLDSEGMTWEYEPAYIPYTFDGKERRYIPDFWVEEMQCFVELHPKALYDRKMKAKVAAVLAAGFSILVIDSRPPYTKHAIFLPPDIPR